ncbi:hypothetical protein Taro_056656, partial [Colocasia esculenta]|nr:hypothetical protein [Colocasia esculenta]
MQYWSGSVDTSSGSVDTRDSSQNTFWPSWDSVSTLAQVVSTLEAFPEHLLDSIAYSSSLLFMLSWLFDSSSDSSSSALSVLECFFRLEDSPNLSIFISWAMRDPMSFSNDIIFKSLASSIAVTFGVQEA